jgi:hypothetical protein
MEKLFFVFVALVVTTACERPSGAPSDTDPRTEAVGALPWEASDSSAPAAPAARPAADDRFTSAAGAAWRYVAEQTQSGTGLVNSVRDYPYATMWDIGSQLGALFSAVELGLIDADDYDDRMGRALGTLATMRLFEGAAFNKNYRTWNAQMAARNDVPDRPEGTGYGWSALDLGRMLVWLRIIADNHPQHAAAAKAVVDRLDLSRIVRDGYLRGESILGGRIVGYQEGRIGYEQYAARGFALWGATAPDALDLFTNARPLDVRGIELLADSREGFHLTSEPFVLLGLEVGWDAPIRSLAWRLLAAQQRRFEETGQMTIVSEDGLPDPPHYFYYYSVNQDGGSFVVGAQGVREPLSGPRWVSAKAAFAWHALLPGEYTALAVDAVARAAGPRGWGSGIYEGSGDATGNENLNTAAVILESALYQRTGRPLLFSRPASLR